jgi:peptidyl-prolyl cis-trans isomerase D
MLQTLRDKSSGWIALVIVLLLCVPFAFFGMEQYLFQRNATFAAKLEAPPAWWPSAPDWWPATMLWQREEIGVDEFQTVFEQQRQQQRQVEGEAFDVRQFQSAENKRQVLETLIDRRVLRMAAARDGIVVGDAQLQETIQDVPAFQVAGKFDPQTYQLALASQNQTPQEFQEIVRNDLQQTILPRTIAESAFVTKSEIDRLLRLIGETRSVRYLVLPLPEADTAELAAADIQRWYQQNSARYRASETVTVEVLDIDGSQLPEPPQPSEATLRERYEQEQAKFGMGEQRLVSHVLVKDEAKARELVAKARADGADFAALARENSEDAGSKGSGGDLGWIERNGAMVKPFEDAVFDMQPGEIRGPVKTDFGYHVIQVREVKAGQQQPFEEVREQLLAEQVETDRERAFNDLLGKLVDEVYKNPTTLAGAARLGGLQVRTLGPLTRTPSPANAADPLAGNQALLRIAFSESLIQDGTVSDPVEISPTRSVLLRVTAHTPERARPLEQVRGQVVSEIRAERADKAADVAADAVLKRLRGGATLDTIAGEQGVEPVAVPELQRGQPAPMQVATEAVFSVPAPAAGEVSLGKAALPGGRRVVFAVDKVVPGDVAEATEVQRAQLREQLAQMTGSEDALAMARALRRTMKITIAEDRL